MLFREYTWVEDHVKVLVEGILNDAIDPTEEVTLHGVKFKVAELSFGNPPKVLLLDSKFILDCQEVLSSGAYPWEKKIICTIFSPKTNDVDLFGGLKNITFVVHKGNLYRQLRRLENTVRIRCVKNPPEEVKVLSDGELI